MRARPTGFTLIDIMITVALIGICALVATSASSPSTRTRLVSAAQLMVSDLEYARELSISGPSDPAVFRVSAAGDGYWIARASATETPVVRSDGKPYSITFGSGEQALLTGVTAAFTAGATTPPTGGRIGFDAFGRLTGGVDAEVTLTVAGTTLKVRCTAVTGEVGIN